MAERTTLVQVSKSALRGTLAGVWLWPAFLGNTLISYAIARGRALGSTTERVYPRPFHMWARRNMWGGGFKIHVEGGENLVRPSILVVNHQNVFDINFLVWLVPPPMRFVAKVEVMGQPLVGSVMREGGHLTVARGAGLENGEAFEKVSRLLDEGAVVIFFPEGTRSRDGSILPLRSGAFRIAAQTGRPVVPLVMAGTRDAIPRLPGPIVPCRLAAKFLPPRTVGDDDANSIAWRESLRAEMAATLESLRPLTGPRI
jgi:1-acyl-sn-glycerol-3-phosphate acyltransferase